MVDRMWWMTTCVHPIRLFAPPRAAAGGRLLHLLQMANARNVCVVVSRWFGGTLLGARVRGGAAFPG